MNVMYSERPKRVHNDRPLRLLTPPDDRPPLISLSGRHRAPGAPNAAGRTLIARGVLTAGGRGYGKQRWC